MPIKQDLIAALGEFVGTTMFLFLGLGGIQTAIISQTSESKEVVTALSAQTITFISTSMGLSLLVTAWVFYRITGGLFNPSVTLALFLAGAVRPVRAVMLTVAQIVGGIAGAALVTAVTSTTFGSTNLMVTTLSTGVSLVKGLFLEAVLTAMLCFCVLMLADEKHKATYLAPVGIGLTLFVCQMVGTLYTGCAMNQARALGPSVISRDFPDYHWIYWVGPYIGSLIAVFFYVLLKAFDYTSVVIGQDNDGDAPAQLSFAQRSALLNAGVDADALALAEQGFADQLRGNKATKSSYSRPYQMMANGMEKFGRSKRHSTESNASTLVEHHNTFPRAGPVKAVATEEEAPQPERKPRKKVVRDGEHLAVQNSRGGQEPVTMHAAGQDQGAVGTTNF